MKFLSLSSVTALVLALSNPVSAQPAPATVDALLQRTSAIVQSTSNDEAKKLAAELLVDAKAISGEAQEIAGKKVASLPRLGSLRFRDLRLKGQFKGGKNLLLLAKGGSIREIHNSILLVDGSIDVSFASSSLIVATGGVEIAHGSQNVVVSGYYTHVSHDGSFDPILDPKKLKSSLLLGKNVIDVSHARKSIISTPGTLSIAHAHRVVGINIKNSDISFRNDMKDVASPGLPITLAPFANVVGAESLYYPPASTEDDYATGELCFAAEEPFVLPDSRVATGCCGETTQRLAGWKQVGAFNSALYLAKDGVVTEVKVEPEPEVTPRICNFTDVPQTEQP